MRRRIIGTASSTVPATTRRPTANISTEKRRNSEWTARRPDLRRSAHVEFPRLPHGGAGPSHPLQLTRPAIAHSGSSSPSEAAREAEWEHWTDMRGRRPPPTKKEAHNEYDYDERRYTDLLQGLGDRTACGVQPRLAALRGRLRGPDVLSGFSRISVHRS